MAVNAVSININRQKLLKNIIEEHYSSRIDERTNTDNVNFYVLSISGIWISIMAGIMLWQIKKQKAKENS